MVTAIYGGSFNPPHVGHLLVSAWLRWSGKCEEVWWVPVLGHAFAKELLGYEERVLLCREVVALLPDARVCEIEREMPVPSYTIDTLRLLSSRYPERRFRLVVGADVLPETDRWKDWPGIRASYDPIAVGRQGYSPPEGAGGVRPEPVEFPGISSTEIRRRAASGEDLSALVPACIAQRVARLYGQAPGSQGGSSPMTP